MASDLWIQNLKRGEVRCRVIVDDNVSQDFHPVSIEQLGFRVRIRELDEMVRGDYSWQYRDFVQSGLPQATYECAAHKTIEKFGQALQFTQVFQVEFSRNVKNLA